MSDKLTNEQLAETVVDTFLPNSAATLESLAGQAAMAAHNYWVKARAARMAETMVGGISGEADRLCDAARRYDAIAARFREVLTWEPMTAY